MICPSGQDGNLTTDDGKPRKEGEKMSYSKLRGRIKEVFGIQANFAEAMGLSTVSLSHKLSGKIEWKTSEIFKACDLLGIPIEDNAEYFFVRKVKKS